MTNERDGITHDYTAKQGVEHAEIVLPEGSDADWARDRSDLWNAAEFAEKRKDARVAREFEIALPHELSAEQRLEAAREMAALCTPSLRARSAMRSLPSTDVSPRAYATPNAVTLGVRLLMT